MCVVWLFHVSDRTHSCMCHMTHSRNATSCISCVIHCNTLQHTATHCNTLQHTAAHCNTLVHVCDMTHSRNTTSRIRYVIHCSTLQHTATHCNTLQHTATHCNTLQQSVHQTVTTIQFVSLSHTQGVTSCNLLSPSYPP